MDSFWIAGLSKLSAVLVLLVLAGFQQVDAVPTSDDRDPAMPESGLGRLFGPAGKFQLTGCTVQSQTATEAVVGFNNTFPTRQTQYKRADSTWTAWQSIPAGDTSYTCDGACLNNVAAVRIRGCEDPGCASGTDQSQCQVDIGLQGNGPPALEWSGIETTQAGVLGCVQGDHTEIVVRMRYAGAHPGSGYPLIGGQAATERTAERATLGSVSLRTYVAPAGWTAADIATGRWDATVSLDNSGSRDAALAVQLNQYCLSAPGASLVGSGNTLSPLSNGDPFAGGSELEIATGNPSSIYVTLTNHELSHDGTVEPFGRVTPASGATDTAHTWSETATGRDGLAYTSPELALTAQALNCETDPAQVRWWLDPGDDVSLPLGTGWQSGPVIQTNACPGATPADPSSGFTEGESQIRIASGSVLTGWPVEVQALQPSGEVDDLFYWFSTGWDTGGSDWYFSVDRDAALSCPSGQRPALNGCETCPTYQQCSGNSLATTDWCQAGTPPTDSRLVTHQACIGGSTTATTSCVAAADPDPVDSPCATSCPPGQVLNAGICETCQVYQACNGNVLEARQWCQAGSPPADSFLASYQTCDGGIQVTDACFAAGSTVPADEPCNTGCPDGEWQTLQWWYDYVTGTWYDYWACTACATYEDCNGDSLVTRSWCSSNPIPADSTTASYEVCQFGTTVTVNTCLAPGVTAPADDPCPEPPPCQTYTVCDGSGALVTQEWCDPGAPPANAFMGSYETCQGGATQVISECFAAGAAVPADAPCGACPPPPDQPSCISGEGWVWRDQTESPPCGAWEATVVPYPSLSSCETASWDSSSCSYDVQNTAGEEPVPGICETVTLDTLFCTWDVTYTGGTPPPTGACETAVLDPNSCTWSVVDTATAEPDVGACFSTSFDANSCTWSVVDNTPAAPSVGACDSVSLDTGSCTWSVTTYTCPDAPVGDACGSYSSSGSDSCGCPTYSYQSNGCPAAPSGDACGSYTSDGTDSCGCPTYSYVSNGCPAAPSGDSCGSYTSNGSDSCGCPTYSYQSNGCPAAPTTGACESVGTSGNDSCGCPIYTVTDITEDPPQCDDGELREAGCGWTCVITDPPDPVEPGCDPGPAPDPGGCATVWLDAVSCSWQTASIPGCTDEYVPTPER